MRAQGLRARSLRVGAALFVAAGCGQLLGVSNYRVGPTRKTDAGTVEAGALTVPAYPDGECETCRRQYCSAEVATCAKSEPCATWDRCMVKCTPGDGNCEHPCYVSAGKTDAPMGDVAMCTFQNCYDDCKAGAAAAFGAGCGDALRGPCGEAFHACAEDSKCIKYWKCLFEEDCLLPSSVSDTGAASGRRPSCAWDCSDQADIYMPEGTDGGLGPGAVLKLGICAGVGTDVSKACDQGDLSCAGKWSWLGATQKTVHVVTRVHNGLYAEFPGSPLVNALVRVCPQNGSSSCNEAAHQPTNSDGLATFDLSTGLAQQYWYFEVTPNPPWPLGPSKLLFHAGRPLLEDTFLSFSTWGAGEGYATIKSKGDKFGIWDPSLAALDVKFRSCNNNLTRDLTIHVDDDAGATVARYYGPDGGKLTDAPGDLTIAAVVLGIAPGVHTVTARDITGRTVSEDQDVVFERDAVTMLPWLEPITKQ